jgi:uncharacterized membrane protein
MTDMSWLAMGLCMLVFAIILIVAMWFIVRQAVGMQRRDPAEDLLRQRFASGEIDADEYQLRLTALRG